MAVAIPEPRYNVPAPPVLVAELQDLGAQYGVELVAHVASDQADGVAWASQADVLLAELADLRRQVGTVRAQVTSYAREDRAREAAEMGALDDLRTAQGNVAALVASIGLEATAAADRITSAVAALQAQVQEGTLNDVTTADVAALQDTEARLRAIGDTIAALGRDTGTAVPPVEEATPVEGLPGTPPDTTGGAEPEPTEPEGAEPEDATEPTEGA